MTATAVAPGSSAFLAAECERLLTFAERSRHPGGGFAWLDEEGRPDLARPAELWITCRMTHVFALAHLLGRPGADALVDHGLAALRGPFRDAEHGGWLAGEEKRMYDHAFVVLAASSAAVAGRDGARELLAEALDVVETRFWDEDAGLCLDVWDRSWLALEPYRGANANMHAVEAFLATGEERWLRRALRITERVVHEWARANDWRLIEHFDEHWNPRFDYNAGDPAHAFRPYGATVGHWLEWARLAVQLHAALGSEAPGWLLEDAHGLYDAAIREGWAVDGADGFVYTVDWDGTPVVRDRLHWVLAEATATAAVLDDDERYREWWNYAAQYLIDAERGSWRHELDPSNRPAHSVWDGKPDAYHAVQATLIPRLPLTPTLTSALLEETNHG